MKILTSEQMRELDYRSIHHYKISSLKLMNQAGLAFVKSLGIQKNKKILVICGPGHNGGDGFVIAKLLKQKKSHVTCVSLIPESKIKGDSLKTCQNYQKQNGKIYFCENFNSFKKISQKYDVIVDAIFGTGFSKKITGFYKQVIEWANNHNSQKWSVDIPSGLSPNTGKILGIAFKAHYTVTFGNPKIGFFINHGPEYVGQLHIQDIGLSLKAESEIKSDFYLITKNRFKKFVQSRKKETHKGNYGHVFVIAGSFNKMGAGLMTAISALKAGCGLSTLVLPKSAFKKIEVNALEVIIESIEDDDKGFFQKKNSSSVLTFLKNADVTAIGPGMGLDSSTIQFVWDVVLKFKGPIIIDADGLNAVAQNKSILKKRKNLTLLTPHPKEMSRLTGKSVKYIQKNRFQVAKDFAKKYHVYLLLKGYNSILAFPDGKIFINPTGNPTMAQAGHGDVLTGIYAGLISQWPNDLDVLAYGCFLHGLTGDLLAQKDFPAVGATEIMKNLNLAIKKIRL